MFESWGDYFFMIGSSAAALIGLMFVVVTLTAGRDRQETERGKQLYTSPIVFHLAAILVLSGAAMAPAVGMRLFAVANIAVAVLGFGMGMRSAIGIARRSKMESARFDMIWYGVAPAVVYLGLATAAIGILEGCSWGVPGVAGSIMALLLVSIHAEWDLVTFLAPIAGSGERH